MIHLSNITRQHGSQVLFRDAEVIRNTLSGATAVLVTDLIFAVLFLVIVAIIALIFLGGQVSGILSKVGKSV